MGDGTHIDRQIQHEIQHKKIAKYFINRHYFNIHKHEHSLFLKHIHTKRRKLSALFPPFPIHPNPPHQHHHHLIVFVFSLNSIILFITIVISTPRNISKKNAVIYTTKNIRTNFSKTYHSNNIELGFIYLLYKLLLGEL